MKTQISKPARGKASYTTEYKLEALKLWRASGRSAAKVASELGTPKQFPRYRRPRCIRRKRYRDRPRPVPSPWLDRHSQQRRKSQDHVNSSFSCLRSVEEILLRPRASWLDHKVFLRCYLWREYRLYWPAETPRFLCALLLPPNAKAFCHQHLC